MDILKQIINFFLHVDENLVLIVNNFGIWSYGLLFLVIFCETGLVVTPFLPGDSLIFAAGALSAGGALNIVWLFVLLVVAAFVGDTVNYWTGHYLGPRVFDPSFQFSVFSFQFKMNKIFKKEYLHKAQAFYEKHGGAAIVLARFVPIVRTFAPFVAGVSKMSYKHFVFYNFMGGAFWVTIFLFTGYYFGNLPWVKAHFEYLIIVIILISVVPMFVEWWKARKSI